MSDGVLVVDKPKGPTSHDIVAIARKGLRQRAVGHAGTLDPMATGVLVLAVGEGTKLVPYLTADDKEYIARVSLGAETDTLDAEGSVTRSCALDGPLEFAVVRAACDSFEGTSLQEAPAFSAIKVDGVALHRRARRGEVTHAPSREVTVHRIEVEGLGPDWVDVRLHVSKGFFVRAFARDLARKLGSCGHLTMLRRTVSGPFGLEQAVSCETLRGAASGGERERDLLSSRLIPIGDACSLRKIRIEGRALDDARHGRAVEVDAHTARELSESERPFALVDSGGGLVALARMHEGRARVIRGFRPTSTANNFEPA